MVYIFVLGRILLGGYFIMMGLMHLMKAQMLIGYAQSKGVPMPKAAVLFTGLLMLLGGLGVLFWTYVTYSVYALVLFLVIVSFKMHQFWTIQDPMQKMPEQTNFMKNMALTGALLMLLFI